MSAEKIDLVEKGGGVIFPVTVAPRASRSEVTCVHDGALKVHVKAAPVEGVANKELVALLSKFFGVSKSTVKIVSGKTSKRKKVCVDGMDKETLTEALGKNDLT